ncbi:uncharacterized protein C9orf85 homolog isoform X2 [Sarcophilus harrisii]|uniref:uncharacterized protein C9orf85 homolog isoform X2 n=1 Tax=Sarcophilus harrisii TaxID=9305 RepID=UPI001301ACA5|nr:uncharacterized protein C9orf85 homolog isoform X2 [Sarcophilus harrisii]
MSSQKGNVTRTRPQRHQNAFSFKNDKFDTSIQTKRINAKLHDGVCQRCKEVLEWRVKYSKYKPLSKPKKWLLKELWEDPTHKQLLGTVSCVSYDLHSGAMCYDMRATFQWLPEV